MVIKQIRVDTRTQFADSSVSLLWISAILKMMEAQGVAERISILALKAGSRGRNATAA